MKNNYSRSRRKTPCEIIRKDIQTREDGKEYRGLSRNQICMTITYDGRTVFVANLEEASHRIGLYSKPWKNI